MGEKNMGINLENRAKWEKEILRRFVITLNRNHDMDMIEFLESKDNVRQYLMNLIRKDMDAETTQDPKDITL